MTKPQRMTRDSGAVLRVASHSPGEPTRMSYEIIRTFKNGAYRAVCRVTCVKCGGTEEFNADQGNQPNLINRRWQQRGWAFHLYNPDRNICPGCLPKKRDETEDPVAKTEKPTEKLNSKTPPQPPESSTAPVALTTAWEVNRHDLGPPWGGALDSFADPPSRHPAVPPPAPLSSAQRLTLPFLLSPDEKTRVRALLDLHFDDKLGRYIDGYSDRRVADESGLPGSDSSQAAVKHLREAAYGPLKEDERLSELRSQFVDNLDKIERLAKALDQQADFARVHHEMILQARTEIDQAMRKINQIAAGEI